MSCDGLIIATNLIANISFLLATVVGLIVSILGIAYMLGSIFNEEKYKSFAKREFYNLAISLLLITLFLPIIGVIEVTTCQNGVSMYDNTIQKMENIMYGEIYPVVSNLYRMSIIQTSMSGLSLKFGPGSFKPLAFLNSFSQSLNLVNFIIQITFTSLYIQSIALSFLKVTAFNLFFPLGIFFRAIPYLRSYGTLIMAFSLSLATIYPYIYFVSLNVYYDSLSDFTFSKTVEEIITPTDYSLTMNIDNAFFLFLSVFHYNSLRDIFFTFGRVLFLAVGIPALALIFTVACTSSISKFLKDVAT
jgi:hypothetical protein